MNNAVFGRTVEYVRKLRVVKLVTIEARRNYLVSKPNYHTTNFIFGKFFNHRNEKIQIFMNIPIYLGPINIRIK